jgi:hypothetical protein
MATPTNLSATRQGAALDPITHYILTPVLLFNFGLAIYLAIHAIHAADQPLLHLWFIVLALALILINIKTRVYALAVQDRVIRLEERQRLAQLLSPAELTASHALSLKQLIGLRFASDAELPALVRRTLAENLTQKQIKEAIQTWRPDNVRV